MMDILLDIFGGGAIGAIVGTIGAYANKRLALEEKQEDNKHDLAMARLGMEEAQALARHELDMADKQMQQAKVEGDIEVEKAELAGWVQSMKSTGNAIMDTVRAVMRPVITIYMLVLVSWLAYRVSAAVGGLDSLDAEYAMQLWKQIIGDLMFLTLTVVTWWFGSRPQQSRP